VDYNERVNLHTNGFIRNCLVVDERGFCERQVGGWWLLWGSFEKLAQFCPATCGQCDSTVDEGSDGTASVVAEPIPLETDDGRVCGEFASNRCYFFSSEVMTWQRAEEYCTAFDGRAYLAKVETEMENAYLGKAIHAVSWIGNYNYNYIKVMSNGFDKPPFHL
jgi:hypothetical protein